MGLWTTRPTADPLRDLEGGGSFAAAVQVYLPYLVLSACVAGLAVAGLTPGRGAVWAAVWGSVLVAAFAGWVLSRGYLLDYLPGLHEQLLWTLPLSGCAAGVAAASWGVDELPAGRRERATRT
ncbi:hypothetical protein [Nocardia huaxiensis]|uniref:hypothetical protein n=1 Tax=Nocardia huaxiensis TaxID=2755382 RepID=UPI001E5D0B16|nr:hypothetical protein [Nocardia huaxiensis]UFS94375.1 hypothetical protein LPY97_26910 [Nocardia huaxiensis]